MFITLKSRFNDKYYTCNLDNVSYFVDDEAQDNTLVTFIKFTDGSHFETKSPIAAELKKILNLNNQHIKVD